jgi:multisubunit Na+/H+ antiporter MnhE subunit
MSSGRAVLAWLGWWVALLVLYLALADSRRLEEIVAGAVVAALGATVQALVRREREVSLALTPRMLLDLVRPLRNVPRDLVLLTGVLARRSAPRARTVRVPFAATGRGPHDAAERAVAVLAGSLSPNSVVIEVDEEGGSLLVHRLVDEP